MGTRPQRKIKQAKGDEDLAFFLRSRGKGSMESLPLRVHTRVPSGAGEHGWLGLWKRGPC